MSSCMRLAFSSVDSASSLICSNCCRSDCIPSFSGIASILAAGCICPLAWLPCMPASWTVCPPSLDTFCRYTGDCDIIANDRRPDNPQRCSSGSRALCSKSKVPKQRVTPRCAAWYLRKAQEYCPTATRSTPLRYASFQTNIAGKAISRNK